MSEIIELECPVCKRVGEFEVCRWSTFVDCPSCKAKLKDDFDIVVLEDGDEWDIHSLEKLDEE